MCVWLNPKPDLRKCDECGNMFDFTLEGDLIDDEDSWGFFCRTCLQELS